MQTKRLSLLPGVALVAMLMLLAGETPARAQAGNKGEQTSLAGTWNVTLKFPECSSTCTCPGGVPNVPIPALQMYLQEGAMQEAGGGALFRGPGFGSWERVNDNEFVTHFKFFMFTTTGGPAGSEVVSSHITLTGRDTFEAVDTFDLFNTTGQFVAQCKRNETATRFE